MKKTIVLLAVSVFMLQNAHAQWRVGAKATAVHAWQKYAEGTNAANADLSIWAKGASFIGQYQLGKNFALSFEPGLAQRGSKCEPGFLLPYGSDDAKVVYNYLESPILMQYSIPCLQQKLLFFGKAGVGAAYIMGGYREIFFQNPEVPNERNTLIMSEEGQINRLDYGIHAGAGAGLKLWKGYLQIETRYYHGSPDTNQFFKSKNRSMGYSLGYVLDL